MTLRYASKLGLKICSTKVWAQKIDCSIIKMFEIILTSFQIEDKIENNQFFQKTFLLANFSIKMILEIFFLTLNNSNFKFA